MDYQITEEVTETRYSASIRFSENIVAYFDDNDIMLDFRDIISAEQFTIGAKDGHWVLVENDYVVDKTFDLCEMTTSPEAQIDKSLINNGGIVIYFEDEYTLHVVMVPKCSNGETEIGYYTTVIEMKLVKEPFDPISITAQLLPKIYRDNVLVKDVEGAEDPVLPGDDNRSAYDYNVDFETKIKSNIVPYMHDSDSIFVNTKSSSPSKFNEDLADKLYNEVPLYISEAKVYTVQDNGELVFEYDWDNADSYLVNANTGSKVQIDYEPKNPTLSDLKTEEGVTVVTNPDDEEDVYKANLSYWVITQKVYYPENGMFDYRLGFDIETKSVIPN